MYKIIVICDDQEVEEIHIFNPSLARMTYRALKNQLVDNLYNWELTLISEDKKIEKRCKIKDKILFEIIK